MQHIIPNLDLGKLIKNLQLFLYIDSEVQRIFPLAPIVSYPSATKIKDYIVRSKLYPIEKKILSSRCGIPRRPVCVSIQVTDTFSSFFTNRNFNCKSKCLLYFLSCKTCGEQYNGKTVDKFRSRCNNYKADARKATSGNIESCKQQFLQNRFLQHDHHGFLDEVTLIDKTPPTDPTKREY